MGFLAEVLARLRTTVPRPVDSVARPRVHAPPVDPSDFPDPYVLRVGSTYYAYATQSGSTNVQVMRSKDLLTWEHLTDGLPTLPIWARAGHAWAPAVLPRDGTYVLYFTVRDRDSDRQCISVAVSDEPQGPFTDVGSGPFIFQLDRGGSIDPSPFVDRDGMAYLLWKSDDNAIGQPSSLWLQSLAADGRSLTGAPTELLRHDREWERPLIEAPAMVRHEGLYYLFYSARWWESANYAIGYAISESIRGPFRKATKYAPWLASGGHAAGPGGQEFFGDVDGRLQMAYHAWTPGAIGYARGGVRSMHITPIRFFRGLPRADG